MHILIAPNAFKNSLDANSAAQAIRKGLEESNLSCTCSCFPVGDGGDGTAALLLQRLGGRILPVSVHDPLGRKIDSRLGLIDKDKTGVIELADASGLRLLKPGEYNPLRSDTYGVGELMKCALDLKVGKIILCVGGSATVDGGGGMLKALGVKFLSPVQRQLEYIPSGFTDLASIDTSTLDSRILETELIVLCDVNNKLLGKDGAAAIFGPQKGATVEEVRELETCLQRFRDIALEKTGRDMAVMKYGGAAGGTAAGLSVFLDARLINGIDYFLEITGFDAALEESDLVITGEGSIDSQTLQGKGPFGVAVKAKEKNIPVIGLSGSLDPDEHKLLHQYFDALVSINDEGVELSKALENTSINLTRTARALGDFLQSGNRSFIN